MRLSDESNMTMLLTPSSTDELWSMRLPVESPTTTPKVELFAELECRNAVLRSPPTTSTPTSKPPDGAFLIVTPAWPAVLSMPTSHDAPSSAHASTGAPSPLMVWPFRSRVMSSAPITIPLFAQLVRSALELRVGRDRGPTAQLARHGATSAGDEEKGHHQYRGEHTNGPDRAAPATSMPFHCSVVRSSLHHLPAPQTSSLAARCVSGPRPRRRIWRCDSRCFQQADEAVAVWCDDPLPSRRPVLETAATPISASATAIANSRRVCLVMVVLLPVICRLDALDASSVCDHR